jgi:hypothetical protein
MAHRYIQIDYDVKLYIVRKNLAASVSIAPHERAWMEPFGGPTIEAEGQKIPNRLRHAMRCV